MKYFEIFADKRYIPPCPLKWYGRFDRKTLERTSFYDIPKHSLLLVEEHQHMVFTDIVTFPCFMVSETVKDIIQKYDTSIQFVRMIFYAKRRKENKVYYLPFLEEAEGCRKEAVNFREAITQKNNTFQNRVIFEVREDNQSRIMVRMDLLESILRRGTIGVGVAYEKQ